MSTLRLRPVSRVLRPLLATPTPLTRPPVRPPALHLRPLSTTKRASSSPSSSSSSPAPILNTLGATHPDINPRLALLTTDTPWRLTAAGTGLERGYLFPTAGAAHRFCAAVYALAANTRHHPEWAGCGRRVYVRWTTHEPAGLGPADVEGAEECERLAAGEGGVAPEGDGGYSAAWVGREGEGGREWVKAKWFRKTAARMMEKVGGEGGGERGSVAVWGNVYHWGCVGRVRWRVLEGEDGRVERVEREPYTGGGDAKAELGERTEELRPNHHSAEKIEGLMQEVMSGWYRHTPEAELEGRSVEELRRKRKEAEKNDTGS